MKPAIYQALAIILLASAAAWTAFCLHPAAPALHAVEEPLKADEVGLKEIRERWQDGVIWLDARPREQFLQEHIPGARLLNEQEFDALLLELLDELQKATKPVVIYCGGQKCEASRHVREKLLTLVPLEDCFILKGGWPAWKQAHPEA